MDNEILAHSLHNALKYKGKANPKAIVGQILRNFPEARKNIKKIMEKIEEIVDKVNTMSLEDIQNQLKKIAPELLEEKKKEEKDLKELNNVSKKGVVMRFAPSPSGPMHIGHAATGCLNAVYVNKYGGTYYLRIEDTNSDKIYEPAYKMLTNEAKWLFGKKTKIIIQSDRMKLYYSYAEKLLKRNAVYVCLCSADKFREYSKSKKECPCRSNNKGVNLELWKKMFKSFKAGEAVLRFKSDMKHKNPAMRDFPLARINDSKHPRQGKKYRVWPLMNLSVAVDDIEMGMTHIIRAKDHADNAKRQKLMYEVLKKNIPENYFLGKYHFEGLELSSSVIRKKIEEGKYSGWDDIRLPTISALRRRGYKAEAFLKFSEHVGLSTSDKVMKAEEYFKLLNNYNKEVIDAKTNRYFLVKDPVEIGILDCPKKEIKIKLHPDYPRRGKRTFKTSTKFYITKEDHRKLKPKKLHRLMDCCNFIKKGSKFIFVSSEYEKFKHSKEKGLIMHYLPKVRGLIKFDLFMPDGKKVSGFGEECIKNLKECSLIQAERVGFCKLNSVKKNRYNFWFCHR